MRDEYPTKILVIESGTSYMDELGKFLSRSDVTVRSRAQFVPSYIATTDVVIISGGHGLPVRGNESEYAKEIDFIKTATVPILGICLGYELIAHAFGANVELVANQENEVIAISLPKENKLFEGVADFSVYASHRWMVKALPAELVGLAQSSQGYEIIKHTTKPMYGFQFHPGMVVNETLGNRIFTNALKILKRAG